MKITPFRRFPKGARNLIIYYAIAEPGIIGFVIFNAYLLLLGYSVIEIGAIISGASLITSLLLPLLGYLSDKRINAKYFLMSTEALIALSFLVYALATDATTVLIGRLIFSTAMLFTFASNVYEKELYPKDKLDDIYIWHWLIPAAAGIASYLIALFYFTLFPNLLAMKIYYLAFGIAGIFYVAYVCFMLPDLPVYREKTKIHLHGNFILILLVVLLSSFSTFFIYGLPFDNIVINYFGSGVNVIIFIALIDSIIALLSSSLKMHLPRKIWKFLPQISMSAMGFLAAIIFFLPHIFDGEALFISFLGIYVMHSFFWPLWHMSFKPLLLSTIPQKLRGTVFSSIMLINRLATIPLAFITGIIIHIYGAFSPALLSSLFAFLTLGFLVMVRKK